MIAHSFASNTAAWRPVGGAVLVVTGVGGLCAALWKLKLKVRSTQGANAGEFQFEAGRDNVGKKADAVGAGTEVEEARMSINGAQTRGADAKSGLPMCENGPEEVGLCRKRLAAVKSWSDGWVASGKFPGLLTVILRKGKIAFAHGSGFADSEHRMPFQLDTIVRIYSMTKPVVAVGIMILYERGLFQLDEKIEQYLPSFAQPVVKEERPDAPKKFVLRPASCEITFHHLLTHTSGLAYGEEDEHEDDSKIKSKYDPPPVERGSAASTASSADYLSPSSLADESLQNPAFFPLGGVDGDRPLATTGEVNLGYTRRGLGGADFKSLSLSDFVDRLGRLPLAFDPGTSWKYSYSYDVLGRLIEVVSGQTLDEFLEEAIFRPLRMPDTAFWLRQPDASRVAALYEVEERPPPGGIEVDTVEDRRRFEKHDSYAPVITLRALKPLASKSSFAGIGYTAETSASEQCLSAAAEDVAESEAAKEQLIPIGAAQPSSSPGTRGGAQVEGSPTSPLPAPGGSKATRLAILSLCLPKRSGVSQEEALLQENNSLPAPVLEVLLSQLDAAGYSRVLVVLGGARREKYQDAIEEMQRQRRSEQDLHVHDLGADYRGGFALSLAKTCDTALFQRLFNMQDDKQFLICRPSHLVDAHLLQNLARISLSSVALQAVVLCESDIPPGGYEMQSAAVNDIHSQEEQYERSSTRVTQGQSVGSAEASLVGTGTACSSEETVYLTLERTVEAPTPHGLLSHARTIGTEREHVARHGIELQFKKILPSAVYLDDQNGDEQHGAALSWTKQAREGSTAPASAPQAPILVAVEIGAYLCGTECSALLRKKSDRNEEFGLAEFFETEVKLLGTLRAQGRPWFAVKVKNEKVEILRTSRTMMRQGHAAGRFQLAADRLWPSPKYSVAPRDVEADLELPTEKRIGLPDDDVASSRKDLERPAAEVVFSGTRNHRHRAPQQVHVQRFRLKKRLKKEQLMKRDSLGRGCTPWVVGVPGNTVKQVAAPAHGALTSLADLSFGDDAEMERTETRPHQSSKAKHGSTPSASSSRYEYDAAPRSRPPMLSGGGGLLSTGNDYMRFCQMLLNKGELDGERVLSRRTVEYMRRNHLPTEGRNSRLRVDIADIAADSSFSETSFAGMGFGLGWSVVMDPVKASLLSSPGEHGWGGMASTFFALDPAEDMAILSLAQLVPSDRYPTRRQLRTLVYQALL
ncbi:unnamed protein product [Amoebophrya sp. A25]|nr:unnamed protein product [Amoebophrya sp. A25]|eukprot:GSA25T00027373001.1